MKAMAVSHNRQKVAVVGTSGYGMASLSVDCVENEPASKSAVHLSLHRVHFVEDEEGVSWPALALAVGDEITIRIVEVESDDPPPKRGPRRKKPDPSFDFNSRFGRFK